MSKISGLNVNGTHIPGDIIREGSLIVDNDGVSLTLVASSVGIVYAKDCMDLSCTLPTYHEGKCSSGG